MSGYLNYVGEQEIAPDPVAEEKPAPRKKVQTQTEE